MCFYATQQPCWRLDAGLIGTCPRSPLTLSYGCVPAVVHSLWPVLAGHFFTHSEPFYCRASSFLFFFCLSLPLCQPVFHQCMRWCTTEWGHRRWSSNLLSAPCSPPSTTQAPDLLSCRLWTQKQLVKRCCVCAHFTFPCCVTCGVTVGCNLLGSALPVPLRSLTLAGQHRAPLSFNNPDNNNHT